MYLEFNVFFPPSSCDLKWKEYKASVLQDNSMVRCSAA